MKILLSFASFSMAFLMVIAYGNAQPLFEVQRESFCKAIQGREPISPFSGDAEIKKGEAVFLWMEITAGERALTMLEAKKQMPIYHAWASEFGVTDMIDIGITKEKWLEQADAIRSEFKKRGFFTWRTQSMKRNFKEGRWYISILDANKRPVRKVGFGVKAFRPELVIRFTDQGH
jgi:hypothetical protein